VQPTLYQLTWSTPAGQLLAIEPHRHEVVPHAAVLATAYNDPHNAPLLGHTELLSADDVIEHYESVAAGGGHNFLVFVDGALVGDADLRKVSGAAAEFAFMVAAPAAQGKGLGTKIATLVHAFAFGRLGLGRVYASIIPRNAASRRALEKLGSVADESPRARAYADEPGDIILVLDRLVFERAYASQIAEIRIATR
jgi:RimJ/RimL family protein N-acetyltransferase